MKDVFDDSDRYDSAIGWEPEEKYRAIREKLRNENPDFYPLPFDVLCGRGLGRYPMGQSFPFFGGLWSEGDVVVLLGDAGAGKSLLAVQMAEMAARGAAIVRPSSKRSGRHSVLYIDFERTAEAFVRCYSFQQQPAERRPSRYRFSKNFSRAHLGDHIQIPSTFKNDLDRFLRYAIGRLITETGPSLVVIDSLPSFVPGISGDVTATRVMRLLRAWAAEERTSILVTVHLRSRSRPAKLTAGCIDASRRISDLADSVFAIGRSTLGPDLRYLKHLKSRSLPPFDRIPVFRIGRMPAPHLPLEHAERTPGVTMLSAANAPAQPPPMPERSRRRSPQGFIGFEYIGMSDEAVHVRDYAAEARRAQIAEEKRLKRLRNPKNVIDMFLSPEYRRYLER